MWKKLAVGDVSLPTTATGMARSRLVESVQETPEPATLDLSSRSGVSHVPGTTRNAPAARETQHIDHFPDSALFSTLASFGTSERRIQMMINNPTTCQKGID